MVEGGTTKHPIVFLYRDGKELFKFLFGNPLFQGRMTLAPFREWADATRDVQVFNGPMSGDFAWKIQVKHSKIQFPQPLINAALVALQDKIGEDETLGLVMLGSDETHLTNTYGDKKVHGVYLSCGNIDKELRMKISARCWMMLAEIPIVKFEEEDFQGMLADRLYHKCMNIATESLQECSHDPELMADPEGIDRLVRTLLLAHLADRPEQLTVACTTSASSPISMAMTKSFGTGRVHAVRRRSVTLNSIQRLRDTPHLSTSDLRAYRKAAEKLTLNGVHEPYWEDWFCADPSTFLTPDALHQWHKFFYEHVMRWARSLFGDKELDKRYSALQKRVGYRHFNAGFTGFTKHNMRESRDLQRSFIGIIYGHDDMDSKALKAFASIVRFIYYAQFEEHTNETLDAMDECLKSFHDNKRALTMLGCRDGPRRKGKFNIPKLETMLHVLRQLRQVGTSIQYSTEQVERCHITMAKIPYKATNRKDFEVQMCRFRDRQEKVYLFGELLHWESIPETVEVVVNGKRTFVKDLSGLVADLLPQPIHNKF